MKDKTLFLLSIMLMTIGLCSSVFAGTCKSGHPFAHTTGGCIDASGTGFFCTGCTGDTDSGGCGAPLTAANVCVHTPIVHGHVAAYTYNVFLCPQGICASCTDPTPPPGSIATGGNGANTGPACPY